MNLLAHAYLTPAESPDLLVGNLTADWIKGRARKAMPEAIRVGFDLHRRIDVFTDGHPATARCAEFLEPRWNRYAPILVDVFFDHILACNWSRFSSQSRGGFIETVYAALRRRVHLLPHLAQYGVHMMIADDWLTAYSTLDGIRLTLTRMSSRLQSRGHSIELAPATEEFARFFSEFDSGFDRLIADFRIRAHSPCAA